MREYQERWLEVKEQILHDTEIKGNISTMMAFLQAYSILPKDTLIGRGTNHQIGRAGIITLEDKEIHLALRGMR